MERHPKVNIIVSTYNGSKYIREQLKSLFDQSYPNIDIYVRDDGSDDGTLDILKEYEASGTVTLIRGENLGFCGSFMELLRLTDKGDFWSFCDQDDIWYPDQVALAVKWLERQKQEEPLLYYSLSEMAGEKGESLGIQEPPKNSLSFYRAMTGTFGVGFSMVINKRLREEMLKCDPKKVHSHDWLAGAVALGFGRVHVNRKVCAMYRRLDSSVTRITFAKKMAWGMAVLTDKGDVKERNMEYYRVYKDKLSPKRARIASLFGEEGYSFKNSLIKVFYPRRWRPGIVSEIVMRGVMLRGKV